MNLPNCTSLCDPLDSSVCELYHPVQKLSHGSFASATQVLQALQRLVNALGAECAETYAFLLPVLQYATNPDAPEALNLLEDGLATWLTALRCAPSPHPGLLALYPHLTATMERSTGTTALRAVSA